MREALEDPDVAIVGCAGAVGVRSIAWWQGAVTWAVFTHRYREFGGGDFPAALVEPWSHRPPMPSTGEVDSIDGFVMVLSPWAVRDLRFDESLGKLHGYDFDFCMQARAAGKKVVTADLRAIHHHSLELISDPETWIETYIRLAEKWDGHCRSRGRGTDWRPRAARRSGGGRRQGSGRFGAPQVQGREVHNERLMASKSWRWTAPLRMPRDWLRRLRARRARA